MGTSYILSLSFVCCMIPIRKMENNLYTTKNISISKTISKLKRMLGHKPSNQERVGGSDSIRIVKILSCASGMGSPTNHPGFQAATRHGARDPLVRTKKNNGPHTRPILLRQGEPGTSQYIPVYGIFGTS